jgi:azurin
MRHMSIIRRLSLAIVLLSLAVLAPRLHAQKAPRVIEMSAGDDMKYSVTEIAAKPGEALRIHLTPKGTMPKVAMAHNVVILKIGTDQMAFTTAAANARATNFIPPELKAKVIAASALAGNGESIDFDFTAPKVRGKYPYVCTFPGHFVAGMKGTLTVK